MVCGGFPCRSPLSGLIESVALVAMMRKVVGRVGGDDFLPLWRVEALELLSVLRIGAIERAVGRLPGVLVGAGDRP